MFAPVPVQLLVVEAHLACGRVVEVIRSEGFRMPRSDLEMLVQSHTEGAAWGGESLIEEALKWGCWSSDTL